MTLFSEPWLAHYQTLVNADPEMRVVGDWFTVSFSLTSQGQRSIVRFERGQLTQFFSAPRVDAPCAFGFRATDEVWSKFLAPVPDPLYQTVFSMLMRVPGFVLEGDTLVAMQHARALHRATTMMRLVDATGGRPMSAQPRQPVPFESIIGRYLTVAIEGVDHRIYVEEAGSGVPLLCLHTAGADSRQYRHLLNDAAVTDRFRVIAFDLPYHGRSNPPDGWWLTKYKLTRDWYVSAIRAVWQALALDRPVVLGCSMGGAILIRLAAEYQSELRGIVGLESTAYAPGRYNTFLHHPAIDGSELTATYTYGLCAPQSPEANARENWWYYAQAGPGVYAGDVHYYSLDWDGRPDLARIDTRVCKVSLLTGEYDYSCTPEMTRQVAAAVAGSRMTIMAGIGHFPMIENYPLFREHLLPELALMLEG